ncbi:MAG: hypothetical protein ACK58U_02710 [Rubrivivax sp.]|jgi:hypothetical protein
MSAQRIYLKLIGESVGRLNAALGFELEYRQTGDVATLDAAVLQLRKALEAIAIAAIAPDKNAYQAFRATADKDPDFTKDYHAAKIFSALAKVNPDFYPLPLLPAERNSDGTWHYGNKTSGVLSKKQFERCYDRLGKHLHTQNPWGSNKNLQNLSGELANIVQSAKGLLALHARFIRAPDFHGVWVVQADTPQPTVLTAQANGPYAISAA